MVVYDLSFGFRAARRGAAFSCSESGRLREILIINTFFFYGRKVTRPGDHHLAYAPIEPKKLFIPLLHRGRAARNKWRAIFYLIPTRSRPDDADATYGTRRVLRLRRRGKGRTTIKNKHGK